MGAPPGGNIGALAIDPVNPSVLYAGARDGGIFKSINGGASWRPAREGLEADVPCQIAIAAEDPGLLYAAAICEPTPLGSSVFKSVDGGAHWTTLALPPDNWHSVLTVRSEVGERIVLAGGDETLCRSADGGNAFSVVMSEVWVNGFAAAPAEPRLIYLATYTKGLWQSRDYGATWQRIATFPFPSADGVAVDPEVSNRVFVGCGEAGLFLTEDGGSTWDCVLTNHTIGVCIAPSNRMVVWATQEGTGPVLADPPELLRSFDGGATWTQVEVPTIDQYLDNLPTALEIDPFDPDRVLVGFWRAGVFLTRDGGDTWIQSPLMATTVSALAVDPKNPQCLLAGTVNAGCWKTVDGGTTWLKASENWTEANMTVAALAFHPDNPQIAFLGASDVGVFRSTDAGSTWWPTSLTAGTFVDFAFGPLSPVGPASRVLWVAAREYSGSMGAWRSDDGGVTWTQKSGAKKISAVAVHPQNPDIVLLGGNRPWPLLHGILERSADGGETWTTVYVYRETPSCVDDLLFDPVQPSVVYAASQHNMILKSVDAGLTWITNWGGWDPGGRVGQLAIAPDDHLHLHATTGGGMCRGVGGGYWSSPDGGLSWNQDNGGLWQWELSSLAIGCDMASDRPVLYVGCASAGLYTDRSPRPMMVRLLQIDAARDTVALEVEGGATGQPVVLETSADLRRWTPVFTGTATGDALDVLQPVEGQPIGFYRAKQ